MVTSYSTIAADVEAERPLVNNAPKRNAKLLVGSAAAAAFVLGFFAVTATSSPGLGTHVLEVPQLGRWRARHLRPEVSRHESQYTMIQGIVTPFPRRSLPQIKLPFEHTHSQLAAVSH